MVSDYDTRSVRSSGRWPCSVCKKGVSSNSIFCVFQNIGCIRDAVACKSRFVPDYKCRKSTGEIRPLEGLPAESLVASIVSLEVVNKF